MSKKKNILPVAACAAVIVGLVAMWVVILKGNGNGDDSSGLMIVDDGSSSAAPTNNEIAVPEYGTILENVDIYKYHDYPSLSDADFVTLSELAENKDKYIDSIVSGSYDNFRFAVRPDFDVPEEIGRYQIATLSDYRENAEEALKYLVGDDFNESYIYDMIAEKDYRVGPLGVMYQKSFDDLVGTAAEIAHTGMISYYSERAVIHKFDSFYGNNVTGQYYVADGKYTDDTYTIGGKEISISQFAENVKNYLDGLSKVIPMSTQFKLTDILASPDEAGSMMFMAELAPMYKSVPLLCFYPGDNRAEDDYNLMNGVDWYDNIPIPNLCSTNGETIELFYIDEQYRDYKTLEEYDKIIAPDKAAKLLSEYLAPDLNGEIIGMGLTYFNIWVGIQDTEALPIEGHICFTDYQECPGEHYKPEIVYELTPFWTFYFDLNPSVIGLVNCKTGEVSYLHNYAR